ncbi:class I SAM-dependent methyltransferase [Polynucleobacter sp. MWH-Creno-3A4]|uniref:class I SAM-dependent methyltransferase n=1 Tax=Polynucleobacter sp. MWH-Creno-3A4 TaxID=1855886 RepID=UPI001C0C41E5|nr:class I SAM-dependent methyltransferase [Polynucleobacter sp. MWH-Creno-3A4]MBU3606131.1 class I SAM-dependent methyltransferase [Polynucleobacter sp. MWH-Creno-3A4]
MKLIERTYDVITGNKNMEDLHTDFNFPVFMGCVDHSEAQDIRAEQTWQINKETGVLQLKKLIPLDVLYQSQHAGAVGSLWMEHHREFAKFLAQFSPLSVLELGGAHGILSLEYASYREIPWSILEPNPAPVFGCKANFIKGFFDEKFKFTKEFDAIVHSHVFEHIYDPDIFMGLLSGFMSDGKKLIFSLPNMVSMLERNYTNCINFEHTVLLNEEYINFLLAKHGFKIIKKEYFKADHSIFYSTVRDLRVKPIQLANNLYDKNKKLFLNYINNQKNLVCELNEKIKKSKKKHFLFGAHIFSQFLMERGLNVESIECLLDNDSKKHGRRLYGTKLLVKSPIVLKNLDSPVVILRAGVYNDEIKKDILMNINPTVVFI